MGMKFFKMSHSISVSRVRFYKVKTLDSADSENKGPLKDEGTSAANQKTDDKEVEFDLRQYIDHHRKLLK